MPAPAVPPQKPPSVIPYIAVLLAFGVGFSAGSASRVAPRTEDSPQPAAAPAVGSYAPDAWKIWVDEWPHRGGGSMRGHVVSYPRDFEAIRGLDATGSWIGATTVTIAAPADAFSEVPNNFGEALLAISVADDIGEDECYLGPDIGGVPGAELTETAEINGVAFRKGTAVEGAAGSRFDTELYRTFRDEVCTEVALIVRTTDIGNHPPGVHEFDKERAFGILRTMLGTFGLTAGVSGAEGP